MVFEGVPSYPDAGRCWQVVDKYKVSPAGLRMYLYFWSDDHKHQVLSEGQEKRIVQSGNWRSSFTTSYSTSKSKMLGLGCRR